MTQNSSSLANVRIGCFLCEPIEATPKSMDAQEAHVPAGSRAAHSSSNAKTLRPNIGRSVKSRYLLDS